MRGWMGWLCAAGLALTSLGPFPRYLEELRIGGGYGSPGGGADFARDGGVWTDGDVLVGGDMTVEGALNADMAGAGPHLLLGEAGQDRGVLEVAHGAGNAAPGAITLRSPDGSAWRLFASDDGVIRVTDALPASNDDGVPVGSQF